MTIKNNPETITTCHSEEQSCALYNKIESQSEQFRTILIDEIKAYLAPRGNRVDIKLQGDIQLDVSLEEDNEYIAYVYTSVLMKDDDIFVEGYIYFIGNDLQTPFLHESEYLSINELINIIDKLTFSRRKISQQPTNHILVKANCQSEWDNCDFAIITCDKGWMELMEKRMYTIALHNDDAGLISLKYSDVSADFYVSKEGEAEKLLSGTGEERVWAFVELEENEEREFDVPENTLDSWTLTLYKDGTVRYTARGKHTDEQFFTERIPIKEIMERILKNQIDEV